MRRFLTTGLILGLLAGCSRPQPPAAALPLFEPERWFQGGMHSKGALTVGFGAPRGLQVQSTGRLQPDGSMRLDQVIHWAGGSVDRRFWLMRSEPGGRYAVSLSDARGPVSFETQGARGHLRYRDRHGPLPIMVEQWMDLQPDGVTLANRGRLTVFGLPIGRLDETVVHEPRP